MSGDDERVVLILFSDTGGGHRRAAEAVVEALAASQRGSFRPVLHDPLLGSSAARRQRWVARLYAPVVRRAPWLWGAGWYVSNSRLAMAVLSRTVFGGVSRTVEAQVRVSDPDVIVSCHPLTGRAAVLAAQRGGRHVPVVTLVTDLARVHASWREPGADVILVPTAAAAMACRRAGIPAGRCVPAGLPVSSRLRPVLPAASGPERQLPAGLARGTFVVLLAGGGEGCGGIGRRAASVLRRYGDVHVVAACGRNERLRRRLNARAPRSDGRLTVLGYVGNFADWLRAADVVVTKAGPAIIAEAAACATPLLLTSHLPGQERGNADIVVRAGAGRSARGIRRMLTELAAMRADPVSLAAMRAGSASLARPGAAAQVADVIGRLAGAAETGRPASPVARVAAAVAAVASGAGRGDGGQVR